MTDSGETSRREARFSSLVETLKARGLRMTPQRLGILRALVMHPDHPSAEKLYQGLASEYPTMSLATVYKTIAMLKQAGEVLELEFSGRDNRFDGFNPRPHAHLICAGCGQILDPPMPNLGRIMETLAEKTGYDVISHRLDFYGLCPDCRDAS